MPNRQPEALTASVWLLIASASWRKRSSSTRAGGIAGTWTGGTVRVGTGADIIGGAVWDGAARRAGRAGEGVENVARSGAKSAASDAGIGIDQISATGGGLRRDCERTSWPEMEARRRAGLLLVSGPLWVKPGPRALSVALPFNPSKRNSGDGRETSQWRHFRKLESTLGNGHCELVSPTSCTLLGQVACSLFDRQDEWYAASIWAT